MPDALRDKLIEIIEGGWTFNPDQWAASMERHANDEPFDPTKSFMNQEPIEVKYPMGEIFMQFDTDGDGAGEYGSFAELAGTFPCRVSNAGAPGAGTVGTDELNPPVLSAAFGNVVASQVQRSGYVFQMYLPDNARTPISEGATGGFTGSYPGADNGEVLWCCYAWPVNFSQTGNRSFFVNQAGDIYQYNNKGTNVYSGAGAAGNGPAGDSIFQTANDMGSPVCNVAGGLTGQDGENWVPVQ